MLFRSGEWSGPSLTFEFALTGGWIFVDDGMESSMAFPVSGKEENGALILTLEGAGAGAEDWRFTIEAGGTLSSNTPPQLYSQMAGAIFTRCEAPADRGAIKLDKPAIEFLSAAMPPENPVFVDLRAKDGCGAPEDRKSVV